MAFKDIFSFLYINRCLTIECFLKEFLTEEVPSGPFLRLVIVNRGNLCKLKPNTKNYSCRMSKRRIVFVFESFLNIQTQNEICKFLLLQANVDCQNCLIMVDMIISLFPSFVFCTQLIYLFMVFIHSFLSHVK